MAAAFTEENLHFCRLCRLLIDWGTVVLGDVLERELVRQYPGQNFESILNNSTVKNILGNIKPASAFNQQQVNLLYPSNCGKLNLGPADKKVKFTDVDISLSCILLRNICGLKPPTSAVWNDEPQPTDISLEANITRLRFIRNTLYGHKVAASLTKSDFTQQWHEIVLVFLALSPRYSQADYDNLKSIPIISIDLEHKYRRLLEEWKNREAGISAEILNTAQDIREGTEATLELMEYLLPTTEQCLDAAKQLMITIGLQVEGLKQDLKEHITDAVREEVSKLQVHPKVQNIIDQKLGASARDTSKPDGDIDAAGNMTYMEQKQPDQQTTLVTHLVEQFGEDWTFLGVYLGLKKSYLDQLDAKYPGQKQMRNCRMLLDWLRHCHEKAVFNDLKNACQRCERDDLVGHMLTLSQNFTTQSFRDTLSNIGADDKGSKQDEGSVQTIKRFIMHIFHMLFLYNIFQYLFGVEGSLTTDNNDKEETETPRECITPEVLSEMSLADLVRSFKDEEFKTVVDKLGLKNEEYSISSKERNFCMLYEWFNKVTDVSESIKLLQDACKMCGKEEQLNSCLPKVSLFHMERDCCGVNVADIPVSYKIVDLSDKTFDDIPVDTEGLDLSNNNLTEIPESIKQFTKLKCLVLNHNKLRGIPSVVKLLKTLEVLCLGNNPIENLNDHLKAGRKQDEDGLIWPSLKVLDIGGLGLKELPAAVTQMKQLEQLYIYGNDDIEIDDKVKELSNLKVICLSNNEMRIFPENVLKLKNLRHLDLAHNRLEEITENIHMINNLEFLDIAWNNIESLPLTITSLTDMKTLDIKANRMCKLPVDIEKLKKLSVLDASSNVIDEIPPDIGKLGLLKILKIRQNKIKSLPASTVNLKNLLVLDIIDNVITDLPAGIEKLENLTILMAHFNKIKEIPQPIGELQKLRELLLCGNEIKQLPESVTKLKKLRILDIRKNQLEHLPNSIDRMTNLEILRADHNRLKVFPDVPEGFLNLEELSIENNEVVRLPPSIAKSQKLEKMLLKHNKLIQPPQVFCDRENTVEILSYLNALQFDPGIEVGRQTCLVLGETLAGKTCVTNVLVSGAPFTCSADDRTKVLDSSTWKLEEDGLIIQIIDFGGHESYKITHKLFLTTDAIVLLVFDACKYESGKFNEVIGDWIRNLQVLLPKASVHLVATHSDQLRERDQERIQNEIEAEVKLLMREREKYLKQIRNKMKEKSNSINSESIKAEIQNVKTDIYFVSCTQENFFGFDELKTLITETAKRSSKFTMPHTWAKFVDVLISQQLRQKHKYYIPWEEIEPIRKEMDLDEKDVKVILKYLRDVGQTLYFDSNVKLSNKIFHNIKALVEAMKIIFNHDLQSDLESNNKFQDFIPRDSFSEIVKDFTKRGLLSEELLKCLLNPLDLTDDELETLLALLELFDLCFKVERIRDDDRVVYMYLFPWHLKDFENNKKGLNPWPFSTDDFFLILDFDFGDYFPPTLFYTVLVVVQEVVAKCPAPVCSHWKSASEFKHDSIHVKVSVVRSKRQLQIVIYSSAQEEKLEKKLSQGWTFLITLYKKLSERFELEWPGAIFKAWCLCPHCVLSGAKELARFGNFDQSCGSTVITTCPNDDTCEIPAALVVNCQEVSLEQTQTITEFLNKYKQRATDETSIVSDDQVASSQEPRTDIAATTSYHQKHRGPDYDNSTEAKQSAPDVDREPVLLHNQLVRKLHNTFTHDDFNNAICLCKDMLSTPELASVQTIHQLVEVCVKRGLICIGNYNVFDSIPLIKEYSEKIIKASVLGQDNQLSHALGEDWMFVGIYLGMEISILEKLDATEMLLRWLSDCHGDRTQLAHLKSALLRSERSDLVNMLESAMKGLPAEKFDAGKGNVSSVNDLTEATLCDMATCLHSDEWRALGKLLGFNDRQLGAFDFKYPTQAKLRNFTLLFEWFKTIDDRADGKRVLNEALKRIRQPSETEPMCTGVDIVHRADWEARSPRGTSALSQFPVPIVFIHHTAGAFYNGADECKPEVRGIQNDHMSRGWDDIGYSFLVGGNGSVFEGRGWFRTGAHTRGYNDRSLSFALMGNYENIHPTTKSLDAIKKMIEYGVSQGYISDTYTLSAHRDASATASPGKNVYSIIKTWPHYSPSP